MRTARLLLGVAMAFAAPAFAQQMPDPAQMAGQPLPAPELPAGSVSVRVVRERMGNNVTDQIVRLTAPGRELQARTDAQGRARFDGVPAGTRVTVDTVVDGESLRSQEFAVPASGGVRVALIAGLEAAAARDRAAAEAAAKQPPRSGIVTFGGETRIIIEFQNDNLQVFYLLDIVNGARTPIDIGEPMIVQLPDGAVGAGALEGSSTLAMVQGDRIRISGPFPPGSTAVQVGYRMPYRGDRLTLEQTWPAAMEQVFVAAEKIGELRIGSPQLTGQREATAGGSPFVMATGPRLNAGDTLTITLTGLPHHDTLLRDAGVALAALVLIAGFWAAFAGGRPRQEREAELARRRERLFADLVALEQLHAQGGVDAGKYAARRQSLVAQLERVLADLDRSRPGGEGVAA